ncbi:hypothetical protein [Paraburkholderia sp. BL25I1N1]|uniref:hypothetical protein n=1 Tax=Paraburkholderia sp. BL25I1N1 TaxID=1938804 RepID=UPI000D05F328
MLCRAAGSPLLFSMIEAPWLKAGPIANRLFDTLKASTVLNAAHEERMVALQQRNSTGVRRAVEKAIFVASRFLRDGCRRR